MKNIKLVLISITILIVLFNFVLKPIIMNIFYSQTTNFAIKGDARCEKYKTPYADAVRKKANMDKLLAEIKKEKCSKL